MSLDLLRQRLADVKATCLLVHGPAELAQALGQYAGLVLEDHPWLRAAAGFFPADSPGVCQIIPRDCHDLPSHLETAVTIGLGAVPETGAVLLSGANPQALRLSLAPRRHIVVIPAPQATLSLAQALELTAQEPSGLVSWVTGPSRTADIEKVLVLGAQGASELVVIIYREHDCPPHPPT